jgi:hypothetical protein
LESKSPDLYETVESAEEPGDGSIVTTEVEIEGFKIVRAIAAEVVDPERVVMRDSKSYCAILLDDNNRKPIVRLHFNNEKRLRLQVFDGDTAAKVDLGKTADIYQHREGIHRAITRHLGDTGDGVSASSDAGRISTQEQGARNGFGDAAGQFNARS